MKYILIIVLFYWCSSCVKNEDQNVSVACIFLEEEIMDTVDIPIWDKGPQKKGYGKAIKHNEVWEASCIGSLYKNGAATITFFTHAVRSTPYTPEVLDFIVPNFTESCNNLYVLQKGFEDSTRAVYFTNLAWHVGGDNYRLIRENQPQSKFSIDSIWGDSIKGRFAVSFVKDTSRGDYDGNPLYLRFLNGEYQVKMDSM